MKFTTLIIIMILAIVPALYAEHLSVEVNKVKVVKHELLELDEKYCSKSFKAEVIEVNATYNRLELDFKIEEDFPMDVELLVEVLRSDLNCDRYEKIGYYTIPFCNPQPSDYDVYLFGPVLKLKASGKCFQKGTDAGDLDFGCFKFEELLSKEQIKNAKFIMYKSLVSNDKVLLCEKLHFVSNIH